MTSPRRYALLALLPLTALLAACGDDTSTADDTPDGTTGGTGDVSGQTITLYSGRDEELIAPLIEKFTDDTGIVQVVLAT